VVVKIPYFYDVSQNYAGSKEKSYEIIRLQMYAILDEAKPNTENIRGFILGGGQAYDRSGSQGGGKAQAK
jgi:hypothetical protein